MITGCQYQDNLILGSFYYSDTYELGPTVENYPDGFVYAYESNPTVMRYSVTGSATACQIQYIDANMQYIDGASRGTTHAFGEINKDFLYIDCRAESAGTYVANVDVGFTFNGKTYAGSKSYEVTVNPS